MYYSQYSSLKIATSELRNPLILQKYVDDGYKYIRRLNFNYHHIMREPTNGCLAELTTYEEVGSVLITSVAAKKLIQRISYF